MSEVTQERIREIFMSHGFTIKEGQNDLRQYVYDAAYALLAERQRKPPCARHCESQAYEIEKRQLVRLTVDYMEVIAKQRVALKQAWEVLGSMDVAITSRTLGARIAIHEALDL